MSGVVDLSGTNLPEFSTPILKLPTSMFLLVLLALGLSKPTWPIWLLQFSIDVVDVHVT